MNNNEIFSHIQTIFNYDRAKLLAIFALVELEVTPKDLNAWLSDEHDNKHGNEHDNEHGNEHRDENDGEHEESFVYMEDEELANFLNALIIEKRGRRDGPLPEAEDYLTNNIVLKKLRIALDLKSDDILEILESVDMSVSKYELGAMFRREDHRNYRNCKNNVLRAFLKGIGLKHASGPA